MGVNYYHFETGEIVSDDVLSHFFDRCSTCGDHWYDAFMFDTKDGQICSRCLLEWGNFGYESTPISSKSRWFIQASETQCNLGVIINGYLIGSFATTLKPRFYTRQLESANLIEARYYMGVR